MRRVLALALLGLAAYALFLAITLPAAFVASVAASRSGGTVRLDEARGTAWNGEARASIAVGPGARLEIERLRWRLEPSALAAARIAFLVEASAPGLEARGEIARGFGEWHARDLAAKADAARLAAAIPLLATWRPQGSLALAAPHLTFDGRAVNGEAALEWRDAGVALSNVRPLGAWRLEASANGGPGRLAVTTLAGPVRMAGEGTFHVPDAIAFDGTARAEGADAAALDPLLDLLGPRRPDGARTLTLRAP